MDTAEEINGSFGRAVLYPVDESRSIITAFALESNTETPATTNVNQILAWPLWSEQGGAILLANYSGAISEQLSVTFQSKGKVKKIRSLRSGKLNFTRVDSIHTKLTLPLKDVTDILLVE